MGTTPAQHPQAMTSYHPAVKEQADKHEGACIPAWETDLNGFRKAD